MVDLPANVDTLIAEFTEKATPLGTVIERSPDSSGVAAIIVPIAHLAGTDTLWVSSQLAERAPVLLAALNDAGQVHKVVTTRDGARDQAIGLSLAHRAIAETGSVVLDENRLEDRAPSLMTLHNIVLVPIIAFEPTMDSVAAVLREIASRPGGGYASFVTGPSRTADIEMSLTVGVQGPRQITVIFIDSLT